jgi:dTDP-4-dehydrorhamnose 3,5-epimerase
VAERVAPVAVDAGLPGLRLVELPVHGDARGWFLESFRMQAYRDLLGAEAVFVQDNVSYSRRHVLRGLHCQVRHPQGKLVSVIQGAIYDVAVDVRRGSPAFGQWRGVTLTQPREATPESPQVLRQLWLPPGFAHGFVALSDIAVVQYKCTDYYRPDDEACLLWNDPALGIDWPVNEPAVSARDRNGSAWADWVAGGVP